MADRWTANGSATGEEKGSHGGTSRRQTEQQEPCSSTAAPGLPIRGGLRRIRGEGFANWEEQKKMRAEERMRERKGFAGKGGLLGTGNEISTHSERVRF